VIKTYEQPYLTEVDIYRIDTGCIVRFPDPDYKPFRVAKDGDGTIYKLFNLGRSQFNDMLSDHPAQISLDNAYAFGEFFLKLTAVYDPYGATYFVGSLEELKSLNKERTEFSTRPGEFEKKSKRIEREIDSICAFIDFHRLSYDESRDSYEIDYYTWQEHLGELRRITVQLTSTGQADVVDDTVVAKKLGYYWPYVY
jgi:hypothetical protein